MKGEDSVDYFKALKKLRRQGLFFSAASFLLLLSGFLLIQFAWQPQPTAPHGFRWLVLPALTTLYLLNGLWSNLGANHRQGELNLLPSLGWGNGITLMRGLFVAGMTGFLLLPRPDGWLIWLPGILYVLSDAADFFDGYVARVTNHATRLGEILDMSFDGIGVMVAALLAIQYGQVPVWYLAVAFARPLFLAWLWLRRRFGLPVYPIPPSIARRLFAGLQMGFLAVVLLPIFSPPGTWVAATLFALPLLLGFIRDGFFVSGALRSNQLSARFQIGLSRWLPLVIRLAILIISILTAALWWGLPDGLRGLNFLNLILVGMVVSGVLPRLSAIFALCMLGFFQIYIPLFPAQIGLAVLYTVIIYLGGGEFSLWRPEESLFQQRTGSHPLQKVEL